MRSNKFIIVIFILAVVDTILSANWPYLPGDLAVARTIQSVMPTDLRWAVYFSSFAEYPLYFVLYVTTFLITFLMVNRRAAFLSLCSFGGIWLLDTLIRLVVFQPRPASNLIHVAAAFPGSSFPSHSSFICMATFGFLGGLMLYDKQQSWLRSMIKVICAIALLAIFLARVSLGAHWPSDVLGSFFFGFVWISLLMRFLPKKIM